MQRLALLRFLDTQDRITNDLVKAVLGGEYIKDYYADEAIELDNSTAEVFGSTYPKFMDFPKPNETEAQKKYRKNYFEEIGNPVEGFLANVISQGEKVLKSHDCKIVFQEKPKLSKNETIQYYLTKDYYNGANFFKGIANTLVRKVLVEANSVIAVLPNEQKDGYPRPYYYYAKPENIILYKANELCVIKSELKSNVIQNGVTEYGVGDIYYFYDRKRYLVAKHTGYEEGTGLKVWSLNNLDGDYRLHGHTSMPVKKLGRIIKEQTEEGYELRESDIGTALTFLRSAICNSLDKAVEFNHHVSSIGWMLGIVDCTSCNGTGRIPDPNKGGKPLDCGKCNATGKMQGMSGSGLDTITIPVTTDAMGNTGKTPTTIGGYIERPITGAKLNTESFETNMRWALKQFGLEHLMEVPLNQSGDAKVQDKEEGKSFVNNMSEHLGDLLEMVVDAMHNMRFISLSREELTYEAPTLVMPKNIDISTTGSLMAKFQNSETYGYPDYLKLKYAQDLVEKESGADSDELRYFKARLKIDPMPASNLSTKISARAVLSDLKYILTTNVDAILIEAMDKNKGFLYMESDKQKMICTEIAKTYLDEAKDNLKLKITGVSSKSSNQAPQID